MPEAVAGSEVTGLAESPDGKALFINIQHPCENTAATNIADPAKFESHWPGNGAGTAAPRVIETRYCIHWLTRGLLVPTLQPP